MGYSEKTADVRIAQYEKNARTPNAETTAKLAEVLKVSPAVFSPTICASREDLLQSTPKRQMPVKFFLQLARIRKAPIRYRLAVTVVFRWNFLLTASGTSLM